jgi:hypothetical protein
MENIERNFGPVRNTDSPSLPLCPSPPQQNCKKQLDNQDLLPEKSTKKKFHQKMGLA